VVKIIEELCHSEHLEIQGSLSFDPVNFDYTVENVITFNECKISDENLDILHANSIGDQ